MQYVYSTYAVYFEGEKQPQCKTLCTSVGKLNHTFARPRNHELRKQEEESVAVSGCASAQSPALRGAWAGCLHDSRVVCHSNGVMAVPHALGGWAGLATLGQGLQIADLLLQPLHVLRLGFLQNDNWWARMEPVPRNGA